MKTQVMYVILGGSQENMKLRADTVFALKQKKDGVIVIAGLPDEVKYLKEYCLSNKQMSYPGFGSWDTLSNITQDILPNLRVLLEEKNHVEIIAPTGPAHGTRTIIAWELFAQKHHSEALLTCPLSGEADGPNEPKLLFLYSLGKPGILLLYWIAKIMRYKLLKQK